VSTGFLYREAVVVSNLAAIVVQQGELGHGRRLIERGLELCKELEDLEGVATAYNIRAEIERRVGDLDRAEADVRATLATIDKRGFAVVSSDSLVGLALTQTARGLHDEAVASVAEAIQRAEEADSPMAVARARLAGGYVDIGRGDLDAATASLGAAGEGAERLALAYVTDEVDAAAARVAWLLGRRDEALELAGRVFERLGQPELIGALQPGEIYLSCRDILTAYDDPRAAAAAAAGREFVESSAARIDEADLRESFLHRVPSSVALAGPATP
jgi:tetratricopeptide (TPR) repeat protein